MTPSFVRRLTGSGGGRAKGRGLSLTSLIDVLVAVVVFLLNTFTASGECCARRVTVPGAVNTTDMVDAPLVSVVGSQVLVDGVSAGDVHAAEQSGRVQRVNELHVLLRAKRDLWKELHPGRGFPGTVILVIDKSAPAVAVKSVFMTSAFAGYPNVAFMVMSLDRSRY